MKKGILVYREGTGRFEVLHSDGELIELHCGQPIEVKHKGRWESACVELGEEWYFTGLGTVLREGMEVRV